MRRDHYKSWLGLKKQLDELLCESLKKRVTYFVTSYRQVHDSYGRAAVRLDGQELVIFSWIDMYRQETDLHKRWQETGEWDYDAPELRKKWSAEGCYCDGDFISAATVFLKMDVFECLASDEPLLRMLAVLDRRVGKRTLEKLKETVGDQPPWLRQIYELRLKAEGIDFGFPKEVYGVLSI